MSGHHHHHATAGTPRRPLRIALVLCAALAVGELVTGLLGHSLALTATGAETVADVGTLAAALAAAALAARPPSARRTFGLARLEVLAAVANATLLLVGNALVALAAVGRLVHPQRPAPGLMVVVGAVALVLQSVAAAVLHGGSRRSLLVRAAFLEMLGDALGAAAVVVAGIVVALTGLRRADPLAALAVAALVLPKSAVLLRRAVDVLLEAVPEGVDLDEVRRHITGVDGVVGCHDLHAWTITDGVPVLSAHVVVEQRAWAQGEAPVVLDRLAACLAGHFDVAHSTFQLEPPGHTDHEPLLHA